MSEVNDNRDELLPGVDPDNMVAISRGFPNWQALKVLVGVSVRPVPKGWHTEFKTLPASDVCTAASANNLNIPQTGLPLIWLVDPATVKEFLATLVDCYPGAEDFEIISVQGRTVTCAREKGWGKKAFAVLVPRLLGTCGPCEDFWFDLSQRLVARLKTREQVRIEDACRLFEDATFTEKGIWHSNSTSTITSALEDAMPEKPETEAPSDPKASTAQGLKALPRMIYELVQKKNPRDVQELLNAARDKMRKTIADADNDRRRERARRSLDNLIAEGALNLSDDGTEVSL